MACILVVDDEKLVRWSISNGLRRDDHEVFCVANGEKAIEEAKSRSFDLVITDFKMPGMNGAELLTLLKRLDPCPKVLMLTAYSAQLSRQNAMEMGACEYIEKPFVVDEIRELVKKMLSK